jgi:hypothetical protein
MSENLSNSSGGENLVSPPPRQSRPAPAPAPAPAPTPSKPRKQPVTAKPQEPEKQGPITADDMKLKRSVKVSKPITLKTDKKKD